ncbi:two-component system, CitB family, sensor histidine kinase MalK [Sinobaca qinghaiensis]|uniref:histidine kinase n=1 Tax=Sinobaca qinghaiensis TaxID=342944 RepID=A0A419V952_9BACL|nr:DcuS/MalK family sensor histidine kinase [Sinobaca qinghaiensis]RKD76449.1 two-component system, CitB family, sensor histidine kinase MalK [Sinobaca qinghaiensis]
MLRKSNGRRPLPLTTWITFLVLAVLILSLSVTSILVAVEAAATTREDQADQASNLAVSVSRSPLTVETLADGVEESPELQQYTLDVQEAAGVEYIVVMNMDHIRLTHPNENRIGERFVGNDEDDSFDGETYTSIAEGTLGESMRAFVPVWNGSTQVGVVSVGILMDNINSEVLSSQRDIYIGSGAGLLIGVAGAVWLARRIKKTMHGMEPAEISQLVEERESMLASVREGIIAIDQDGSIILANRAAAAMFKKAGIYGDPLGHDVKEFLPDSKLTEVLVHGRSEFDEEQSLNGMDIVVNRVPVYAEGRLVGALATFRDKTELTAVIKQLSGAKAYAETLRAQTHEFMNKLHVMSAMVFTESYEELKGYIDQISHTYQTEVGWVTRYISDPVIAGYLMNKLNYFQENGVLVSMEGDEPWPLLEEPAYLDTVITVIGNLTDNAFEAVKDVDEAEIIIAIDYQSGVLHFSIEDNGSGIEKEELDDLFVRGFSTKGTDRGYGLYLLKNALDAVEGTLDVSSEPQQGSVFHVKIPFREAPDDTGPDY